MLWSTPVHAMLNKVYAVSIAEVVPFLRQYFNTHCQPNLIIKRKKMCYEHDIAMKKGRFMFRICYFPRVFGSYFPVKCFSNYKYLRFSFVREKVPHANFYGSHRLCNDCCIKCFFARHAHMHNSKLTLCSLPSMVAILE